MTKMVTMMTKKIMAYERMSQFKIDPLYFVELLVLFCNPER